jgi:hypothetical protein
MNFCHPLQENISSFRGAAPPHPLLTDSFFLATPVSACLYMIYFKCLDPVELRLHGTRKDYKTRGINRKCKSNNLDNIQINNKNNETNMGSTPVTSATAERSFSALKRIKTYLRSTMVEDRLMVCP